MSRELPALHIRDLTIRVPIVQGGMGVRVSLAGLAAAVSNSGGMGVIASVGIASAEDVKRWGYEEASDRALRAEIRRARTLTDKPFGVNIMVALRNNERLVRVCAEENVDVIISSAGLPAKLPKYCTNSSTKLLPVVSSAKAADFLCRVWESRYQRLPDAIIVEGPRSGGHVGFSMADLENKEVRLDTILPDVLKVVGEYKQHIPVIAAGGIFNGADIARYVKLGASGVQMGTRFVCTEECEVSDAYKENYLNAKEDDIVLIQSPVGLPARVIKNQFVESILDGKKFNFECPYQCLRTCDPKKVNYCLAKALSNAASGKMEEGFSLCSVETHRVDRILSVRELMRSLIMEAEECFQ